MTEHIKKTAKKFKEHKGTVGVLSGSSIGIGGVYLIIQQMIAPLPTSADMLQMELRLTKSFTEKINSIEENLNDSSIAYLEALSKLSTKFDAHEKNFDFLRTKVEVHHRKGLLAHNPN